MTVLSQFYEAGKEIVLILCILDHFFKWNDDCSVENYMPLQCCLRKLVTFVSEIPH